MMEHLETFPNTTLCYLERDGRYLMLLRCKKKNDINAGKWIGVGGKFEQGETAAQCALREIREETGLTVRDLTLRGVVTFHADGFSEVMHLFTATQWDGALTECDEGELRWVDKEEVFNLPLWDGDRVFLEMLVSGAPYFDMTLRYRGDRLVQCVVDGKERELFDILTPDGAPTGMVAERGYAHRHGLWHATAHIWMARPAPDGDDDEILLQLRSTQKKLYPGLYDVSSAGHIGAGENIREGACREVEEELGLSVAPEALREVGVVPSVKDFTTREGEPYHDREYCHVFVCRMPVADGEIVCQPTEVDGVKWMRFGELEQAVGENAFPHCIDARELAMIAPLL